MKSHRWSRDPFESDVGPLLIVFLIKHRFLFLFLLRETVFQATNEENAIGVGNRVASRRLVFYREVGVHEKHRSLLPGNGLFQRISEHDGSHVNEEGRSVDHDG